MNELWNIFLSQEPLGRSVAIVIAALFVWGCSDVLQGRWRLKAELELIARARKRLGAGPSAEEDGGAAIADPLPFLGLPPASLVGSRVARLARLRSAGLGQGASLQALTLESIEGYGALARYFSTILILIGLFGTVFGLSVALFRIEGAFGAAEQMGAGAAGMQAFTQLNQVTDALGGTLGGMKTAFGATMAGILSALILSSFNHGLRRYQSRVVSHMEEFIVCDVLPWMERLDPDADNAAKAFASVLSDSGKKIDKLTRSMASAADTYKENSDNVAVSVGLLHDAVNDFSQTLTRISGNQETFTSTMKETREVIQTLQTALETRLNEVKTFTERSHELLQARMREIDKQTESNQQTIAAVQSYGKSFETLVEGLVQGVNRGLHEEVGRLLEAEKKSVQEIVHMQQTALRSFSDLILDVRLDGKAVAAGERR